MDSSLSSDPHAPDIDTSFRESRWKRAKATAADLKKLAKVHEELSPAQQYAEAARIDTVSDGMLHEELVAMRKAHEFHGIADPNPDAAAAPADPEAADPTAGDPDPDETIDYVDGISNQGGDPDVDSNNPDREGTPTTVKEAGPTTEPEEPKKAAAPAKKASGARKTSRTTKRAATTRKG